MPHEPVSLDDIVREFREMLDSESAEVERFLEQQKASNAATEVQADDVAVPMREGCSERLHADVED